MRVLPHLIVLAFLAPALAGCLLVETPTAARDPDGPVSEALYPIEDRIVAHMPVRAPDGAILDMWVFRPDTSATGEKVPVIINYSPYWSNLSPPAAEGGDAFSLYLLDHFLPRGYAIALVSVRGTGLSEGCFSIGGPAEVDDADSVATFLGTQPWSNGNVTAIAKSYDGTVAQGLLTRNNPHVKTIVPVSPISELYKYNYFGGVTYTLQGDIFNAYYVAAVSAAQSMDPRHPTWQKTPTRFCAESARVQQAGVQSALTGDYTEYWRARNYTALLPERVEASVFYVHGLQDWNVKPDHMVPWIEALRERGATVKMWLGQWAHDYPTRGDFNETLLRWLDHELKGLPTGILEDPLVHVEDNEGVWRTEADWPPTRAARTLLHPSADGALGESPGSGASAYLNTLEPVGSQPNRITFTGSPRPEAVRLVGEPVFEVDFSSSGPRAVLTAALLLDGKVVDQGFLSLNHHAGLDQGMPLVPTQRYHASVRFYPQDLVLPAGSTLSLVVGHAPPPGSPVDVLPLPTGATVTLHHGAGTFLDLPVVAADDVTPEPVQPEDVGCWAC